MPVPKKQKVTTTTAVPTKKVEDKVEDRVKKVHKQPAGATKVKETTKKATTTTTPTKKSTTTTTPIVPTSTKVHQCSFSSWLPKSIQSISYNESNNLVAVARQDSSIEIWNKQDQELTLLKTLGGSKFDLPIISVFWLKGLKQTILVVFENKFQIWDLSTYSIIQELSSIGTLKSSSYNAALNLLAVATHDSNVRLYNYDGEKIEYQSSFPSITDSKTNTIQWSIDGKSILVGCSNQLVIFKVDSLRSILNVTTDEIISLNSLSNDKVVCGFINGFISIIDIKFGSIIQDFRNLHAPVRSIQVTKGGDQFFAAGDESIIVSYNKSNGTTEKWAPSGQHKRDSHDIKCLEITNTHLISGGNSTQLIFYELSTFASLRETNYFRCKSLPKSNISITNNNTTTTSTNPILLIESSRHQINIWSLGNSTNEDNNNNGSNLDLPNGTPLNLSQKTKKLLQFESKNPQNIENVDISNNGEYFCFSTRLETKLYSILKKEGGAITIKKVDLSNEYSVGSCIGKFTKDSKNLVFAKNTNEIYIYNLESSNVNTIYKKEKQDEEDEDNTTPTTNIVELEIDNNSKYISIIDSLNQVLILNINNNNNITPTKLPNLNSIPTKLFYSNESFLYIGTMNSIILFDIKLLKIVSTKKLSKSVSFITNNPNNSNELIIWSSMDQVKVNKDLSDDSKVIKSPSNFTEVIFAAQSGKNDLIIVDLSFIDKVLPTLGEAIKLKRFGGSQ